MYLQMGIKELQQHYFYTSYKKSINFRIKEKKNERIHKKEQSKFGNNVML